jgi:pimeloyl-ACP methyl ester carboxylesterase
MVSRSRTVNFTASTLTLFSALLVASASFGDELNDRWYSQSSSDTVFVFVHGIFSNSSDCWTNSNGTYWPSLLKSDTRFSDPNIYLGGYDTRIDSGSFGIYDAADQLFANLRVAGSDGKDPPLEKKNLVFIAHSTGGIVVRQVLLEHAAEFKDKAVAVILIASPGRGSQWANRLQWLNKFYANRMAEQLQRKNDFLDALDRDFMNLATKKDNRIPRLIGMDLFESKFIVPRPVYLFFLQSEEFVVNSEDTGSYFGGFKVIPNSDHFSIVKPAGIGDPIQTYLADFYQHEFLPLTKKTSTEAAQWGSTPSQTGRKIYSAQISLFDSNAEQVRFNNIWRQGLFHSVTSFLTSQNAPPELQLEGVEILNDVDSSDLERLSLAGHYLNGVAVSTTIVQKKTSGPVESYLAESTFRAMHPLPDVVFPDISEDIPGGDSFGPITLRKALSKTWGYYVLMSLATRCLTDDANAQCDKRRLLTVLSEANKTLGANDRDLDRDFSRLIALALGKTP